MPIVFQNFSPKRYISIWKIEENIEKLLTLLPEESRKNLTPANLSHREIQSMVAKVLFYHIARHIGIKYYNLHKDTFGKPYIEQESDWNVSISHSFDYVLVGVAYKSKIGLDIQRITPKVSAVASRVFSEGELLFCEEDLKKQTIVWSAKESLYKLYGKRKLTFKEDIQITHNKLNWEGHLPVYSDDIIPIKVIEWENYMITVATHE